ncbi:MAG TPA: hypothetical protein VGD50_01725 [Candidatus Baltobacteraceae bacterium]
MSRPIIRTTGSPNLRRRRDLTIFIVAFCVALVVFVGFVESRHPAVQMPLPAASGAPAPRSS